MQSKWKWNSYTYFDEDGIYKNFCQTKDSFIFRVNKVILGQTYAFIPSKFACTKFTVFGILPIFIPVYLVCLSFCVLKAHFLSGSCRKWKHFDFHIWSSLRKHLKKQWGNVFLRYRQRRVAKTISGVGCLHAVIHNVSQVCPLPTITKNNTKLSKSLQSMHDQMPNLVGIGFGPGCHENGLKTRK